MRNELAFDFANPIGLPYPRSRGVDLRINGVYRGNYLLTEKVEVKTNRVELTDAQGVLAELDNNYGTAEDFWFTSGTSKTIFTLKDAKSGVPDPTKGESMSDAAYATTTKVGWDDMKSTINQLDSLLAASTPNWTAISALIDLDSFVKYYFVNELTENPEITSSSIYFYKNGTADKLHAGPVWDYDSAVGNYDKSEKLGAITYSSYTKNAQILRAKGNGWYYRSTAAPSSSSAPTRCGTRDRLPGQPPAHEDRRVQDPGPGVRREQLRQVEDPRHADPPRRRGGQDLRHDLQRRGGLPARLGEQAFRPPPEGVRHRPHGQVPVARREQGLAALRQRGPDLRHRRRGPTVEAFNLSLLNSTGCHPGR